MVNLKLPEEVLVDKCLGRRTCNQCGKGFNIAHINLKGENGKPGISMDPLLPPPQCMSKLITRADDTEEVVKARLRIYNETVSPLSLSLSIVLPILAMLDALNDCVQSQPLEEYYRSKGKLMEFDLPGGIPESWPRLLEALRLDDYEEKQSAAA